MFTVRFLKHGGAGHRSYSCVTYEVTQKEDRADVKMELQNGDMYVEQIGPESTYEIAYVTNESGKTIDKVVGPEL